MIFVLKLLQQTVMLAVHYSPKNKYRVRANHNHCDLASTPLHAKSSQPRTCRTRGSQCINWTAKNIMFVSHLRPVNRWNITLLCDNASTSQHLLRIFTTWKWFFNHFLALFFPAFVHYYFHNFSIYNAKIQLLFHIATIRCVFTEFFIQGVWNSLFFLPKWKSAASVHPVTLPFLHSTISNTRSFPYVQTPRFVVPASWFLGRW